MTRSRESTHALGHAPQQVGARVPTPVSPLKSASQHPRPTPTLDSVFRCKCPRPRPCPTAYMCACAHALGHAPQQVGARVPTPVSPLMTSIKHLKHILCRQSLLVTLYHFFFLNVIQYNFYQSIIDQIFEQFTFCSSFMHLDSNRTQHNLYAHLCYSFATLFLYLTPRHARFNGGEKTRGGAVQ